MIYQPMQNSLNTERLLINTVTLDDAPFILELLNTPGWLKFIGDRNVKTIEDAKNYILKLTGGPGTNYFLVKLLDQQVPAGVITLMKRDYLDHHDIGFAFHPDHAGKGYAFEAAKEVLDQLKTDPSHTYIQAIVLKTNTKSVQLIEKLGLTYEKDLKRDDEDLFLYSLATKDFHTAI
ncbi:GNAT family N-acetyltransferase [Pedobacter sp. NJ-S-72]